MSLLQNPGDLAETPLAAILLEALNTRATGFLAVAHGEGTSRVYLRDGRPVGAQVAVGFKPLGHLLLQAGVIDIDALSRSLAAMAATRRPQGEILVELGAVTREVVERYLAEQQAGYVTLIASLERGGFRFEAAPSPEWTRTARLPTLRIIVEALARPQAGALAASALQGVAGGAVQLSPGYPEVAAQFRWSPAERALVERIASPAPLEAFFAPGEVPPERARAVLGALLLLELAGPPGEQPDSSSGLEAEGTEIASPPPPAPAAAPAPAPAVPSRRSDPEEARLRRQRLLQRAMQNMGVGPFGGRPPVNGGAPAATPAPTQAAAPAPAPAPAPRAPAAPAGSPEEKLRKALLDVAPRATDKNLFVRLGLDPSVGRDAVKRAYLDLAKQFHPDRYASPAFEDLRDTVRDLFMSVNEAYETLSDDRKRADYLVSLRGAVGSGNPATSMAAANAQVDYEKGEACLRTRDFAKARAFLEAAVRAHPIAKHQAALAWAIIADPTVKARDRARELLADATK
ncbi:MAG TPA: DUF4388 domain-containing protein, partial [Anaeromyxobacteraceae bacterium]|nr:DUF4388 domain-containing protein [Anaeromyxobacteraceae bacterium]